MGRGAWRLGSFEFPDYVVGERVRPFLVVGPRPSDDIAFFVFFVKKHNDAHVAADPDGGETVACLDARLNITQGLPDAVLGGGHGEGAGWGRTCLGAHQEQCRKN